LISVKHKNNDKSHEILNYNYEEARNEKLVELEILKQSIDDKTKQINIYYDQLLRLKADFENYRKRAEKEKIHYLNIGKENIIIKQLNIYDVLEQAIHSIKVNQNVNSVLVGLEMISKEVTRMLQEEGVEEIHCKYFDPNTCEALDYSECTKQDDEGKILKIYQKGYKLNGKLIRTAKVKVAKKQI
jgi:molecular chaperone GrpE